MDRYFRVRKKDLDLLQISGEFRDPLTVEEVLREALGEGSGGLRERVFIMVSTRHSCNVKFLVSRRGVKS